MAGLFNLFEWNWRKAVQVELDVSGVDPGQGMVGLAPV